MRPAKNAGAGRVLLEVDRLVTEFESRDGLLRAVDEISFSLAVGEVLGLVGESGSGKSVTGFSILGLIDPPGRITAGRIRFDGEDLVTAGARRLRAIRGNRIAMIFQDPMMTLNPVLRIDTQMIEALTAHQTIGRDEARARASTPSPASASPRPRPGSSSIRTSSRAACASAWQSPSRC